MTKATRTEQWIDKALNGTRERVRTHPLRFVTGAFAVGFVIGGRLPAYAGRAAVGMGLRLLFARALCRGS